MLKHHLFLESSFKYLMGIGLTSGLLFLILHNPSTRLIFPFCNQYSNGLWPQPKTDAELGDGTLAPPVLKWLNNFSNCQVQEAWEYQEFLHSIHFPSWALQEGVAVVKVFGPLPDLHPQTCHWSALGGHHPWPALWFGSHLNGTL